ncbi:MAG: hypothetical protein CVU43_09745 [Chloroflexi bacterium HGW-Chloroflexi-5]|jgi:hypothetical protein|nr:MAG: hypothetical protein CVU43_09745 [Chloroflexi bacterium HGW-Chloroflexi-5]
MTFPTPYTFVALQILTAAQLNAIQANISGLIALAVYGKELKLEDSIPPLSDLQSAPIDVAESSGSAPNPAWRRMPLDDTTDEGRQWDFVLERVYGVSPTLKVHYYMAGANTSKTVCFACRIMAVSDGDASVTAKNFDAVNSVTVTVPAAAGTEDVATITLTNNDSMAAGDRITLVLYRDVSEDDAVGDCVVTKVELQFSPA